MNKNTIILSVVLLVNGCLYGQINTPSFRLDTNFTNSLGLGPSYGVMLDRNAQYWGLSLGYSKKINENWALSTSLAFDQEFDKSKIESGIVNTFTFMVTATYFFNSYWTITSGFGKGIADDDQLVKQLRFTDGDISTGLSLGRSIPDFVFWSRDSFAVSSALEYNFSKEEFSFSLDLVAGISW